MILIQKMYRITNIGQLGFDPNTECTLTKTVPNIPQTLQMDLKHPKNRGVKHSYIYTHISTLLIYLDEVYIISIQNNNSNLYEN